MSRHLATVASLLTLTCAPALAWDFEGHKASAEVVYARLDTDDRDRIMSLLESHPRYREDFLQLMPADIAGGAITDRQRWLLVQAANWPDHVRRLPDDIRPDFHRGPWHYINHVVWLTDDDRAALDGTLAHNRSTLFEAPLDGSMNAVQALKGNLALFHDQSAPAAARALALCWVLHISADLHQPLHTVALFSQNLFPAGDRGGNLIEVRREADTDNLHYVWDSLIETAVSVDAERHTFRPDADRLSIEEWTLEHANLARMHVYSGEVIAQLVGIANRGDTPIITLSEEYLANARRVAERQLVLAGRRTAVMLRDGIAAP